MLLCVCVLKSLFLVFFYLITSFFIAVTVVALSSIMSVKQSFLDFRVTPDASGKWMKPAQDKIGEIVEATFQANSCFSTSSVTLFTGVNGV